MQQAPEIDRIAILKAFGVSDSDISRQVGIIKTQKRYSYPKLLSYSESDTISLPTIVLNQMAVINDDIVRATAIPFLQQECSQFIDPQIAVKLLPIKLKNVKYHAWSMYLEGDIINQLKNIGKDGKQGLTTRWFWESCPTESSEYDWSTLTGSADIESEISHSIVENRTRELLDKIDETITAKRGKTATASAHWKTKGLGDLMQTVLDLFISGGIVTRNGYDVTFTYEFRGTQTTTKTINAKVYLPISGDIKWVWD